MKAKSLKLLSLALCIALITAISYVPAVCVTPEKSAEKSAFDIFEKAKEEVAEKFVEERPYAALEFSPLHAESETNSSFTVSEEPKYSAIPAFTAYSRLSDTAKKFYNLGKKMLNDICSGECTWAACPAPTEKGGLFYFNYEDFMTDEYKKLTYTYSDLGLTESEVAPIKYEGGGYGVPESANNKMQEKIDTFENSLMKEADNAVNALLADCPFEFFWYAKTYHININHKVTCTIYQNSTSGELYCTDFKFTSIGALMYFDASANYYNAYISMSEKVGDVMFNIVKDGKNIKSIERANIAKANADKIIEKHKNETDIQKLKSYHDEICALTVYDTESSRIPESYGDPWQMINVFDNDLSTNVVCEGYSKAFKYLCDHSSFNDKALSCILASGFLNEGPHMWNIVCTSAGNYLVDVTNDDSYNDSRKVTDTYDLFMALPESGNITSGYTFDLKGSDIKYTFDDNQTEIFGEDKITVAPDLTNALLGDFNTDGKVNVEDCLKILILSANVSDYESVLADVDYNGSLNKDDAEKIAKFIVKNISSLEKT